MSTPSAQSNAQFQVLSLPDQISRFSWKWVVDKLPFAEVSLPDFKRLAEISDGWRYVGKRDYSYSIRGGFSNVDEYVKEALWHHDEERYESLRGYTKTPRIGRAYHSLLKYGGPTIYKSHVFDEQFEAIYDSVLDFHEGSFQKVGIFDVAAATLKVPLNTSAGITFPGLKKGDVLVEAAAEVNKMIDVWKRGGVVEQIPCKMALRGHLSKVGENKTRVIWVQPIEHIILENMFFRGFYHQIFAGLHHQRLFMTGKDTISRLNDYLSSDPDASFTNTDIKGWDNVRARFVLKDIFHRVLKPNIRFTEDWQYLAFDYLVDAFIFTVLCLPDGSLFKKLGGVPSGSFLTLLLNSIAVDVCMTSALKAIQLPFYDKRVLGDDFSFKMNRVDDDQLQLHIHDLSQEVFCRFGLIVSPEKVIATNVLDDRKFIGYQIRGGRLFREDRELLLGMLHPEGPVDDLCVSFTRVFAFMLIGGFNSPVVTRFYERYLGGYKEEFDRIGPDLFNQDVMKQGNLRVFKHVFKVDLEEFDAFDLDSFRSLFSSKVPFFLTFGARFLLQN